MSEGTVLVRVGDRLGGRFVHQVVDGVGFWFERRRYGACQFYTWVYRWDHDHWESMGDPWPQARVSHKELAELATQQPKLELV